MSEPTENTMPTPTIIMAATAIFLFLLYTTRSQLWLFLNTSSTALELIGGIITFVFCYFSMTTWAMVSLGCIVWEAIRPKSAYPGYVRTTHFYRTNSTKTEQSLDIYTPTDNHHKNNPTILLVVGSGWTGHRRLIEAAAHWWNESGPKLIACQLNCKCVCIRHRGGFPVASVEKVVFLVTAINLGIAVYGYWVGWENLLLWNVGVTLGFVVYDVILRFAARGAANLDDMMDDVATALKWIKENDNSNTYWFGGYSSGAHVAAMVLHRPQIVQSKGLPPLEDWIKRIVFLSGCLGVRPVSSTQKSPKFVTDFVNTAVFGEQFAENLPSPLEELVSKGGKDYPKIPHLFLGCEKELFGLSWLDHYFVSEQYNTTLLSDAYKIPSKYVPLPTTNHWFVLSSKELKDVMDIEIETIQKVAKEEDNGYVVLEGNGVERGGL